MGQLVFDLTHPAAFGGADFFVSTSNAAAARWIGRWPAWPSATLVLYGPEGCGKTHLAHVWCARAAATLVEGSGLDDTRLTQLLAGGIRRVAVDNAEAAGEAALLHLLNACREADGHLLLTARVSPQSWPTALADLGSRLRAAFSVGIAAPDDALFEAVLAKHFADRQVLVAPEVLSFLGRRLDRSMAAAGAVAAALDTAALHAGGAITVALVRRLLNEGLDQLSSPDADSTSA